MSTHTVYRVTSGKFKGDLVVKMPSKMQKLVAVKSLSPTPLEDQLFYDRNGKVLSTAKDPYHDYKVKPEFLTSVGNVILPIEFTQLNTISFKPNGIYMLNRYHGKSKEQVARLIATDLYRNMIDYSVKMISLT